MNSTNELCREGQTGDVKSLQYEYANKKGKILEYDVQESGCDEKMGWKKNASSTEATTSVSALEKETVTTKTRLQAVKVRQTCSGPLMPGAVLTHSMSERARVSERFVMNNYLFLLVVYKYIMSFCNNIKKLLLIQYVCLPKSLLLYYYSCGATNFSFRNLIGT